MTIADLAARIDVHMQRVGLGSRAKVSGTGHLCVLYVGTIGWDVLERDVAESYLAWLDAGNVGKHWDME